MSIEVSREHYAETLAAFAQYARDDVNEALRDVETASDYALDGVHRAQLEAAHSALLEAKQQLRWVRP